MEEGEGSSKKPKQEVEHFTIARRSSMPCVHHFSIGGCRYGEKCNFSHEAVYGVGNVPNYSEEKTLLCYNIYTARGCALGHNCPYAHFEEELRGPMTYFKIPEEIGPIPASNLANCMRPETSEGAEMRTISISATQTSISGMSVRLLRRMSGTQVFIGKHDSDSEMVNIKIKGTVDTVNIAKQIVLDRITKFPSPQPNSHARVEILKEAGEMPVLVPPDDGSIRTLYVGGITEKINEQDLVKHFYCCGEIETVKMLFPKACAFVTFRTREDAEMAAEEFSYNLVIKGQRLKLDWSRSRAVKPDEARQQAVAHTGLLPGAVMSQQNYFLQPPGFPENPPAPAPIHYINIQSQQSQHPQGRLLCPSMDHQRMGVVIPTQGASSGSNENRSRSENREVQHYPPYSGIPPPQGQVCQVFYPHYQRSVPPQAPGGHQAGFRYQPSAPTQSLGAHRAVPSQPNPRQAVPPQPNPHQAGPQQPTSSQTAGDYQSPPRFRSYLK